MRSGAASSSSSLLVRRSGPALLRCVFPFRSLRLETRVRLASVRYLNQQKKYNLEYVNPKMLQLPLLSDLWRTKSKTNVIRSRSILSSSLLLPSFVRFPGSRILRIRRVRMRYKTQNIADRFGPSLAKNHSLSGLDVLRMLDESEVHQSLITCSQAILRHRKYRGRLSDTAAVN